MLQSRELQPLRGSYKPLSVPSLLPDSIAALASFPVEQILVGFTFEDLPSIGTKS